MKRILSFLLGIILLCIPLSSCANASSQTLAVATLADHSLSSVVTNFTSRTAAGLMAENGNYCYSPASLYLALALLSTGAGGATRQQLFTALGIPEDGQPALEAAVREWLDYAPDVDPWTITEGEGNVVEIANSLWLNHTRHTYTADFAAGAARYWDADLFEMALGTPAANAQMAEWIADATHGLLPLQPETDPQDALVLLNTLYLSGRWYEEFNPDKNQTAAFHLAEGGTIQTEYMTQSFYDAVYQKGKGYTSAVLGLNCGAGVRFVLPDKGVSVQDLLAPARLDAMLRSTEYLNCSQLNLQLPKFEFSTSINPRPLLEGMGVTDAFIPGTADFTGLSSAAKEQGTYLSTIAQETYIAADEEGVKATAVTYVALTDGIPEHEEIVNISLDRPFLFYIFYNDTPLFLGCVFEPTLAA